MHCDAPKLVPDPFPSIKRQGPTGMHCDAPKLVPDPFPSIKRQGPTGMHCDAPKLVPDPFPNVRGSVTMYSNGSNLMLPLGARCVCTLKTYSAAIL